MSVSDYRAKMGTSYQLYRVLRDGLPLNEIASLMSDQRFFEDIALLDNSIFVDSSRDHFNAIARSYIEFVSQEQHMLEAIKWQCNVLPGILTGIEDIKHERQIHISDFGAGAGALSLWPTINALLEYRGIRLKKERIAANLLDVSEDMKDATRELTANQLPAQLSSLFSDPMAILEIVKSSKYVVYDITSTASPQPDSKPLPKQHVIVCSFVLHHLGIIGKLQALRMLASALREDGVLIVIDEYRSFEEQQVYIRSLQELSESLARPIPYGMECFVDMEWFRGAVKEPGIELHVLKVAPMTSSRLVAVALGKRKQ